ncbi:MAG: AmmeMemoRadiSam system protein A [Deltaproteobacteria bacterium]|nr:AmmeMemoRadiSam system protein A [Deltaproteobacteria bacterium]
MGFNAADKETLFKVARESIRAHLKNQTPAPPEDASPALCEPRGVFVTLHRKGRLRGCIGYLEAVKPLLAAVQEMAAAAAFHDPRFPPLQEEELADLDLEISVLSPMQRIFKAEEIEVGKHGLFIERGWARGLLLPQVATECKWDRITFLEQTCCKAGLPPDAWKDPDTRIYVFTAEIFSQRAPAPQTEQEPQPR